MRKAYFGRALVLAAAGLAAVLPLSACGGGSTTASGGNGLEKKDVKLAALSIVDTAPAFIAQQKGLFKKEGLNVKLEVLKQSTAAIPGMLKGDIDLVAGGNYVSFFTAYDKGAVKLKLVAEDAVSAPDVSQVLVKPDSKIRDVKDLVGKKINVNQARNIQDLTLNAVLKSQNVSGTPNYVTLPFPGVAAALQKGDLDAAWVVEPFATDIQQKLGARKIVDPASGPTDKFPLDGYWVTEQFADKYPNTAKALQRAIQKAQGMAQSDRKLAEQVLPGYIPIDKKTASTIALPTWPDTLSPTRVQRVTDLMHQSGYTKKKITVSSLIVK